MPFETAQIDDAVIVPIELAQLLTCCRLKISGRLVPDISDLVHSANSVVFFYCGPLLIIIVVYFSIIMICLKARFPASLQTLLTN